MTLECCPYCKTWGESSLMYKSAIKKYKRFESAYFCNTEHAIAWKKIHQPMPVLRTSANRKPIHSFNKRY